MALTGTTQALAMMMVHASTVTNAERGGGLEVSVVMRTDRPPGRPPPHRGRTNLALRVGAHGVLGVDEAPEDRGAACGLWRMCQHHGPARHPAAFSTIARMRSRSALRRMNPSASACRYTWSSSNVATSGL